ncbi:hypothetical protein HYG81_11595 [Natrinema zhouii]|uniref:Halobacterial output domain-containing protein n=1 Tax=Natrinema zhouii TaxID=1710539 RepID=A0A7D6CME5_9EURY|nr:HalOD1 output domain-containing protein [Natrinema zhouii]QLK24757.1 hypothetical protein HYG81_11595 [Natrinema zhouii]
MQNTQSISLKVVEKIAEREQVSPAELKPPLHYAIDTDALNSLYQSDTPERGPSKVEFTYNGYTVVVDSTGDVDIRDQVSASGPDKTIA